MDNREHRHLYPFRFQERSSPANHSCILAIRTSLRVSDDLAVSVPLTKEVLGFHKLSRETVSFVVWEILPLTESDANSIEFREFPHDAKDFVNSIDCIVQMVQDLQYSCRQSLALFGVFPIGDIVTDPTHGPELPITVNRKEHIQMLLSMTDACVQVEQDPARLRPSDLPVLRGCADRFVQATGWEREYELSQTLGDTLEAWRQAGR